MIFRCKSMKSLRTSLKNQSVNAEIDEFLKEIDDFRRKSMTSLRKSMKSGCSAMFGTRSGRVRDTFPESFLGRIPQPGFCSRQFSFLSQVCSAESFLPGVSAQLFGVACWSHLALTWMHSDIIFQFFLCMFFGIFIMFGSYVRAPCSRTMFRAFR